MINTCSNEGPDLPIRTDWLKSLPLFNHVYMSGKGRTYDERGNFLGYARYKNGMWRIKRTRRSIKYDMKEKING